MPTVRHSSNYQWSRDGHGHIRAPDGIVPMTRHGPAGGTAVTRALVLGGGGVAGISWEIGILRGVADVRPALLPLLISADLIVGTSAGAAVAAQITSGVELDRLYAAQLQQDTGEIEVDFDDDLQRAQFAAATAGASSAQHARQRIGALALKTHGVDEATRRAAVAARLPVHRWPDQNLIVTAVDIETGKLQKFTRHSGVDLIDAVLASCAVPGVWPAVTIGQRMYMDGAMRSTTNADLAAGADRVLIIAPSLDVSATPYNDLDTELERLKPAAVLVVRADERSQAAIGTNPLSPATRAPAAHAGRLEGQRYASAIATVWH
jgi:NTE family protein